MVERLEYRSRGSSASCPNFRAACWCDVEKVYQEDGILLSWWQNVKILTRMMADDCLLVNVPKHHTACEHWKAKWFWRTKPAMIIKVCYLEEIGACTNDTAGKKGRPVNLRGISPFARRLGTNGAILREISQNTKNSTHRWEKHQLTVHGSGYNQSVCWIQIHRVHLENRNLFTAVFPTKTSRTPTIASKTYQGDFRRRDFF